MRKRYLAIFLTVLVSVLSLLFPASCKKPAVVEDRLGIAVTILPQVEFAESVGRDKVTVNAMVPPGASPESYEPVPAQLTSLARAKIYAKLGSGIDFELAWMDKLQATNRDMLVVDCSKGIKLMQSSEEGHGAGDPHIWSSPVNAKIMVSNISDGLVQVDASNQSYYEQNRDNYLNKLSELDRDIRNSLLKLTANRTFIVYHPAWGYYARDYNLTEVAIEENGREPTAARIVQLIEMAKEKKIKVIFSSPEFSTRSAEVIANAIGGRVVLIDPLARDYIDKMRSVTAQFVQAME